MCRAEQQESFWGWEHLGRFPASPPVCVLVFDAARSVCFSCQHRSLVILEPCVPRAGVAFYKPPNPGTGQWCWGDLECPGVPCLGRGACHLMIKPAPPAQAALQLHKFCLIMTISISMQLLAVTSLLAPFGSVKSLLVLWVCKQA